MNNELNSAALAATATVSSAEQPVGEVIGFRVVQDGSFIGAAEFASTERNQKLLANGSVVRVYALATPISEDTGKGDSSSAAPNFTDVRLAVEAAIRKYSKSADYVGASRDGAQKIMGMFAAPSPTGESLSAREDKARMTKFILGQCIHNMVVAEQAAWIEWKHGAGADAAMQWIENGLAGPGHIPKHEVMNAQEYYNANVDERMEPTAPTVPGEPT